MATYDVKATGAVGDCQTALGLTMHNGSPTLTDPLTRGFFKASDVGKICFGIANSTVQLTGMATIVTFNSVNSVDLSVNAGYDAPAGVQFSWATQLDDDAIIRAFNASLSQSYQSFPGNGVGRGGDILLSMGSYMVSKRIYDAFGLPIGPNLRGEDRLQSNLVLTPNLTIPGDGSPALIRGAGFGARFLDFGIVGPAWAYDYAPNQALCGFENMANLQVENVSAIWLGSLNAYRGGFLFDACSQLYAKNLIIQGATNGSVLQDSQTAKTSGAIFNQCSGSVINPLFSNMWRNLEVRNNASQESLVTDTLLSMFGGLVDEGIDLDECSLNTGARLRASGVTFWGHKAADTYVVAVDGTSSLWLDQCFVSPTNVAVGAPNGIGMRIDAGGEVVASGTIFASATTSPVAIVNNGKFFNGVGNRFYTGASGALVPIDWRAAFSNPGTILRTL